MIRLIIRAGAKRHANHTYWQKEGAASAGKDGLINIIFIGERKITGMNKNA